MQKTKENQALIGNLIDELIDSVVDDNTHDNCVQRQIDKLNQAIFSGDWTDVNEQPSSMSKKITMERVVTHVELYEIYPEQLGAFMDCDGDCLEVEYGTPVGEHYNDKRRVLTTDGGE